MISRLLFSAPLLLGVLLAQEARLPRANYDLASRWTPAKVAKMVFDVNVAPRWFDGGDRFWYSHETSQGRKFTLVDAAKKSKTPLFDHARMASMLTALTRIPYDAQHLPVENAHLMRKDAVLLFEVSVPADAEIPGLPKEDKKDTGVAATQSSGDPDEDPQQRPAAPAAARKRLVYFEYDFATAKLALLPNYKAPRKPRWVSLAPDGKTVVFARGQNLYAMDEANYAKALVKEDDASIVESQLTTDGEENFGYARRLTEEEKRLMAPLGKNSRVPAIQIF